MINKEISSNIYWKRTYDLLKQKRNKIHIMCNLIESELGIKLIQKRNFKYEQLNKSVRSRVISCEKYFNLNSKFRLSFLFISDLETAGITITLQKIKNEVKFRTIDLCDLELINNELFFHTKNLKLTDNLKNSGITFECEIYGVKFKSDYFPTFLNELRNFDVEKYNDKALFILKNIIKNQNKTINSIENKQKEKLELYERILKTCLQKPNSFKAFIGDDISKEDMMNLYYSFGISTDDIY